MSIKRLLTAQVEKITGRKCYRCQYNKRGRCVHPDGNMFRRCWNSFARPGFELRPPRYLRADKGLTAEEQHQLQKIKAVLQDAGDTARESGLVED